MCTFKNWKPNKVTGHIVTLRSVLWRGGTVRGWCVTHNIKRTQFLRLMIIFLFSPGLTEEKSPRNTSLTL